MFTVVRGATCPAMLPFAIWCASFAASIYMRFHPILLLLAITVLPHTRAVGRESVNVNYMLRGYCFAGSRPDKDAFGGYGGSDNLPRKLSDLTVGREGKLSLIALPDEVVPFGKSHQGFRLILVNRTDGEAQFAASDSRLPIVMEAMDRDGRWRPIEYLPSSGCGNSYHRVFLPHNHSWEFIAPKFEGRWDTKLRFVLQGEKPIYSNTFEGSINPGQFTVKQGYEPTGLMDPYND